MKKLLKLLVNPNPILRKVSEEIDIEKIKTPEMQQFFKDMTYTMRKSDGVGLASPQIGENIRMVVINPGDKIRIVINPIITKKSWAQVWDQEGCLSVPNTFGDVKRHKKVRCIYYNEKGKKIKEDSSGLLARVFQHEIDHLNGVLFIDKAKNISKLEE